MEGKSKPGYHRDDLPMRSLPLLFLAVIFLAACTAPPSKRERVVLAVDSPPETLDRRMALGLNAMRLAQLVTPGLTRIDERGMAVPDLAESFEASGERTWTFHLREGLVFSDGAPLTAGDVVATFLSVLDPATGSPHRGGYSYLERVEAEGPLTVIFHLSRPFGAMPVDATLGILPRETVAPSRRDELRLRPIGAGPFVVSAWDGGDTILLDPNPLYYDGAPALPLEIRTVRDETTRLLELRKGRVDLFLGTVSPPLLLALRDRGRLRVESETGAGVSYMMFNLEDPILAKRDVRQAIALALEREALALHKFKGAATVADSLFWAEHWVYEPSVTRYRRNLAEAERLLDRAGHPRPNGGGPRLRISLKTSTDRFRRSIGLAIASQLADAGIELELQSLEWGTFLDDVKRGNFQAANLKWPAVLDPDLLRLAYHSASIPSEASAWGGGNRMRYRNPALDELLEQGRELQNPEERRLVYAKAQRILAKDLPAIPLLHENAVGIRAAEIQGLVVDPQGSLQSLAKLRREAP